MANNPQKNAPLTLTSLHFESLLGRFDLDKDRAGEKYEEIRWKLVKFFQWNFCALAEELADETFDRVARKLYEGRHEIQDVAAFIWGVARNIQQEAGRRETRTTRLSDAPDGSFLSDHGASTDAIYEKLLRQEQSRCLHGCIERLPVEDRGLFLAYRARKKHYAEIRKGLASKLAITPGALRVRMIRLRDKLEKCIKNCFGRKTGGLRP
jgi:RNA polymerase sigma factor (sigma-70 family)